MTTPSDSTTREPPDLVPARMVNEVVYCERLMYLEWAQGEFADNAFTVEGRSVHKRVDKASSPVPSPSKETADEDDDDPRPTVSKSIWLSSAELRLTAKIDLLETTGNQAVPVEFKRGKKPDIPENAYLPERVQLCAQALLLRANGFGCEYGEIYFAADHRRVRIPIDDALIEQTRSAVARARTVAAGQIPPALENSPKCQGCSLAVLCLPDEICSLKGKSTREVRRLQPARDDRLPLYVQEQGARIGVRAGELMVRGRETDTKVRLHDTSQISVFGNVQVTTQALRAALRGGIPLAFFSTGGWLQGRASGFASNNIELRIAQHHAAGDPERCLDFARVFIDAKIRNCRTLIRRNSDGNHEQLLNELSILARKALSASSLASLLGIEGSAARSYYRGFGELLRGGATDRGFDWNGRNRRPPKDPINALLSFSYALLSKDLVIACGNVGLEPLMGFYHQPRFGRPALALDLMEEFRPLVADSVVLSVVNGGIVDVEDFVVTEAGAAMKDGARKRLIQAYERRMDHLITHPIFGYRISYRRVLEVQARLLGRVLLGELDSYPAFRTR